MRFSALKKTLSLLSVFLVINCGQKAKKEENAFKEEEQKNETVYLKGCGFNSFVEIEKNLIPAEPRVKQIVDNILSYAGLPSNFQVYRHDYFDNAMATIYKEERYIIYDGALFNNVDLYTDSFWSSISIIAHEIGHHLSGHTLSDIGSNPLIELEADRFSGHIIYKMGGTLEQALLAINLMGNESDSETHPNKMRRINAITQGWKEANTQRYLGAIPPSPASDGYDLGVFTKEMLLDKVYFETTEFEWLFDELVDEYGVVTEVGNDLTFFKIRLLKPNGDFEEKEREVYVQTFQNDNQFSTMCMACARNFMSLLVPGRRLKVQIIENIDGGTAQTVHLAYAEEVINARF